MTNKMNKLFLWTVATLILTTAQAARADGTGFSFDELRRAPDHLKRVMYKSLDGRVVVALSLSGQSARDGLPTVARALIGPPHQLRPVSTAKMVTSISPQSVPYIGTIELKDGESQFELHLQVPGLLSTCKSVCLGSNTAPDQAPMDMVPVDPKEWHALISRAPASLAHPKGAAVISPSVFPATPRVASPSPKVAQAAIPVSPAARAQASVYVNIPEFKR